MNKKYFKLLLVVFAISVWGCETVDLDQTENPSTIGAEFLDPEYTFNYAQLQLPSFVDETNSFAQTIMRQMAMIGGNTYNNAYAPVNFNSQWSTGYNILNAIKAMEPKATANNQNFILGASKIIRSYVLMTMVDMYGDVPYSQALQGSLNITPKYDKDVVVYEAVLNELDQAITLLKAPNNPNLQYTDLYYGGSADKWIKLANTLKLKMYNNCNLLSTVGSKNVAAEINAIITEGKIIDTKADDFAFQYGNSRFTPNTRHPLYNDQYELNGGAYIGNYMMWTVATEKPNSSAFPNTATDPGDPRTNYYFLRQNSNLSNVNSTIIPGKVKARPDHYNDLKYRSFYDVTIRTPFTVSNWVSPTAGFPGDGFLGRDHGDNSGIPQDGNIRTVAGTYPIGGKFGAAASVQNSGTDGKQGAGIMPIMLSSYVHFMKAELMLKEIIPGNAQDELDLAVSQSIDKTVNLFSDYPVLSTSQANNLAAKITRYRNFISDQFENLDPVKRLELVIKEYYIAAWGNGIEPYNNYRRTGYPSNLQPTLEPVPGPFYNSAFYSGSSVNNNPNTPTNDRTRKVFWAAPNTVELN